MSNTSRWFVWTKTGLTGCHLAFLYLHQSAASRVFSSHCKGFTQLCQFSVKGFLFSDNNRSYWTAAVWWLCILNINSNSKSRKQFLWFLNHKENTDAHHDQTIGYSKLWRSLHDQVFGFGCDVVTLDFHWGTISWSLLLFFFRKSKCAFTVKV